MQEVNIKWHDCKISPPCGVDLLVTDGQSIEAAYAYAIHGGNIGGMSGSPLKRVKNITAWAYAEVDPEQLSDLEIVQKALEKSKSDLSFYLGGNWSVFVCDSSSYGPDMTGSGREALLTWAKQTISE